MPIAPVLWEIRTDSGKRKLYTFFHDGQQAAWDSEARFVGILAGAQGGKALALDTLIPTPNGFVAMGDLVVGDLVFGEFGQPTRITYVSPIYLGNRCYRLTFDDGTTLVADAEHLWTTENANQRKNAARQVESPNPAWTVRSQCQRAERSSVLTTTEIAATLADYRGASNHAIPLASPFSTVLANLLIPPYTLGAWLGDGHSASATLTTADPEVLDSIRADGIEVGPPLDYNAGRARCYRLDSGKRGESREVKATRLQTKLRSLGVLGDKHIPSAYLFASYDQRLAFLQGLMDTDGYIAADGRCDLSLSNERLANDAVDLLAGLGVKVRKAARQPKTGHLSYRLTFTTSLSVFRLPKKAARLPIMTRPDTHRRFIVSCEEVPSVSVRCIEVDNPTHQYLCSRAFIATHNTSFLPLWLWREIGKKGGGDYLAVTSTYDMFKLKFLPECLRVFKTLLPKGKFYSGDKVYGFKHPTDKQDSRIILRSAANPESLESATAKAAIFDEAGQDQVRLQAWEAVLRRLALHQGRVLIGTTLYNLGWLKQQFYERWLAHDTDYQVIQFPSTMNPLFPQAEYERAKRTMPAWKLAMQYRGEYDRPPGLIYGDFHLEYREDGGHKVHAFALPAAWPRKVGGDFGGVNTALIWIAYDPEADVYYAYHESLEGGLTTKEHAEKALALAKGLNVTTWHGGAKSEGQQRRDWKSHGVPFREPKIDSVEAGIDRVIDLIKTSRLYVFDSCKGLLDELGTYSREVDAAGQVTERIKDKETFHRIDALRYVAQGLQTGGFAFA